MTITMKTKITIPVLIILAFTLISSIINLNNLEDYENLVQPTYIQQDNTQSNTITNAGATLGRVLFYDKQLSTDNTIACASCHLQEFAFGDTAKVSVGVNGLTGRHSMRLINSRFTNETNAFWDERASSIEDQSTKPIQDHIEMGYSGQNGDPTFANLILKMETLAYYPILFEFVYGDDEITEDRIQLALAQFVRSIQSYDSKFDIGRAQVNNNVTNFPNFTADENAGKTSYFTPPPQGGAGCFRCHGGSEFSLIESSQNNGVITVANMPGSIDLTNTKAPTLRDLVNPQGLMNGPFMHDGSMIDLAAVVDHYNDISPNVPANNPDIDFRLTGAMHNINLSQLEKDQLIAFLKTLTGVDVYTNKMWSDPFDDQGNITVLADSSTIAINDVENLLEFSISPNPSSNFLNIKLEKGLYQVKVYDNKGSLVIQSGFDTKHTEDISQLTNGNYIVEILNVLDGKRGTLKFLKK